jgi:PKD repeat protein
MVTMRLCLPLALLLASFIALVGEQPAQAANPPADIVFIIDESGSMGDDINAVKANVGNIATQLEAHVDPLYGLVGFGAYAGHWGAGYGQPHTHTDLTDTASFSTALNGLVANGGFEPGVQATIYAMNNLTNWREGAGVCVVLITDEDSDGGDLATARAALDSRNAVWFGIVNPGYGNTASTYGPNTGSLSAHTGGSTFSIYAFRSDPQPVLDALIQKCIVSIVQGITLTPPTATNYTGTDHTVTATVKDNLLSPVVGVQVTFDVTAGPNTGKTGTDTTDGAGEATFTYTGDGGVGTDTIRACFIDQDGQQQCDEATKVWEPPPNQSPVADPNGPYSEYEGVEVCFDGTGSSDPDGDQLTYDWDFGDGNTGSGPTPCHTYADNGTYPVCLTVTDPAGASDTQCTTADIENYTPEVTASLHEQTVQYSDYICDVTFTATDVAADTMTAATTPDPLPDSLVLTDNGCNVSGGIRTCTWTLSGTMDQPVGFYSPIVWVTDDDGGTGGEDIDIHVEHEDADIWLDEDNQVAVEVDSDGDSPSFSLTAHVKETYPDAATDCGGADPGDINNAEVEMTLAAVGPGGSYTVICTPVGTATADDYDAVLEFECDFDDVDVNTYHVQASVVGDYYAGGPDEDVLVVFDPGLGFTTGGGWFYWPDTTEKTNFGFTMKYNKKGTKVQGSLLLIRHVAPGEKYRVKSNALYGLSIGEAGDPVYGWASFSGKCTYLEPGWLEAEGNHEFLVYVEDHGEPGKEVDRFWIEVYDKDDNVIAVMSMDRDAPDNAETLGGGNIVVPHTRASDGSK